jgi:hypothetical protein
MTALQVAKLALTAFGEQLTELGVDLPQRQYVAPGLIPVWDGEQFVVNLQDIAQGQPGHPFGESFIPGAENFSAQYAVTIVRTVPTLNEGGMLEPSEEELNEAGFQTIADCESLVKAAVKVHASQVLSGLGRNFAIDPAGPMGPDGGLAAARLLFTVSL